MDITLSIKLSDDLREHIFVKSGIWLDEVHVWRCFATALGEAERAHALRMIKYQDFEYWKLDNFAPPRPFQPERSPAVVVAADYRVNLQDNEVKGVARRLTFRPDDPDEHIVVDALLRELEPNAEQTPPAVVVAAAIRADARRMERAQREIDEHFASLVDDIADPRLAQFVRRVIERR